MISSLRADEWKWLPLTRWPTSTPWQEQRNVHSKRFVLPTHAHQGGEVGLAKVWSKGHIHQDLLRLARLMQIPGPHLPPIDSTALGAGSRNLHLPQAGLFCCTWKSEDHCCRGPLHSYPWALSSLWAMKENICWEGKWVRVEAVRSSCLELPLPILISHFFLLDDHRCIPKAKVRHYTTWENHQVKLTFKTHIKFLSSRAFRVFTPVWEQ